MNAQQNEIFRTMIEHSMVGSYMWQDNKIIYANKSLAQLVGYTVEEICLHDDILGEVVVPKDLHRVRDGVHKRLVGEKMTDIFQVQVKRKDGSRVELEVHAKKTIYNGKTCIVGIAVDITERVRAQKKMEQDEQQFRSLFQHNLDSVFSLDLKGNFTNINPTCEKTVGYNSVELMGTLFMPLIAPNDLPKAIEAFEQAKKGRSQRLELSILHRTGYEVDWDITVMPIIVDDEVTGLFSIARDITEKKKVEKTLQHMSYYDALTGLPNRKKFMSWLEDALLEAKRSNQKIAVFSIDQNRTRVVNDSFGHEAGDLLLKLTADRLKICLGEGKNLARVGGDEFYVLMPDVTNVEALTGTAINILESYKEPFSLNGFEFRTGVSIGIAIYPEHGETGEELIRNAETALHEVKSTGKNHFKLYTPSMNSYSTTQITLANALFGALERKEFFLYYQPRVDTHTGVIMGTEALLRWKHPTIGFVSPAEFIPLAEELGLIVSIGEWVLQEACKQNKKWQDAGYLPIRMAVNVSVRQFQRSNLVDTIHKVLQETGLDAKWLEIEITEGTLMQDEETIIQTLKQVADLGVHVSIDDFGTGYSSLSYLKRFDIHTLKIDRSFVSNIDMSEENAKITKAVIHLAHSLDMKVVSEGVETKGEFNLLKDLHSDEIQGYYISKPLPPEEHVKFFKQDNREM